MRRIVIQFAALASFFLVQQSFAQPSPDFTVLTQPQIVEVSTVIDPLRFQLRNGDIVQLAGIELPDLDPANPGPLSAEARTKLTQILENKKIRLYQTRDPKRGRVNRMGYTLGHLETAGPDNNIWLQGYLLENGYARARPDPSNPELATEMSALEQSARAAGKGLWADPLYAVRTPENAAELIGRFGIVEGTIHATGMNDNTTFLNFGADWRTDFTIGLDSKMRRTLSQQNIDPLQLAGQSVRIRGWVEEYNGPFIRLEDPAQIEFITITPKQDVAP